MKEIIKHHEDLLRYNKKYVTKAADIQIVHRKSSNLKDLIISGYINREVDRPMTQPCMRPNEIMRTTNMTMMNEQVSYQIRGNFNCQSEHVVYAFICSHHGLKYIRETSKALTTR